MIEYWACIGLACADEDFREQLRKDAPKTTQDYGFRLSRFELAELERLMSVKEVLEAMDVMGVRICPPPPHSCLKASARSAGYAEYREIHNRIFKR